MGTVSSPFCERKTQVPLAEGVTRCRSHGSWRGWSGGGDGLGPCTRIVLDDSQTLLTPGYLKHKACLAAQPNDLKPKETSTASSAILVIIFIAQCKTASASMAHNAMAVVVTSVCVPASFLVAESSDQSLPRQRVNMGAGVREGCCGGHALWKDRPLYLAPNLG